MKNFEDHSHLIDEAKQFDKKMQSKVDAGEAQNFSEAQELVMFDETFAVDRERDIEDIKKLMRRVRKDPKIGRMGSEYSQESDKKYGWLKYSDEQVEAGQWEEGDLNFVIEELRKERIDNYFGNVARKYEPAMPIPDSIVRLNQEAEIAETLRGDKPVLIRGNWRMGKTSMMRSLETHQFGSENSIIIDAMAESAGKGESLEDFQKHFGVYTIARFIAERELAGAELEDRFKKENEVRKQIAESQKSPFEFLNDYLVQRGEKVFLSIDEVIGFAEQPEKLKYLADLKGLSNIQLAIVLHRFASFESSFKEIFDGYETHFVHPLTLEEVGILIRKPLEGTQITFTDDAIQKIFEFTGGRPMEINNVCRALMDQFSEHKNYRFTYRVEDIDALTKKETWQFGESFRVAIDTYKRVYGRSMSDEERAIIDRLIERDEVPVSEIDAEKIQPLIDTTFIAKDESKGIYRVNGVLFKRVVLDQNL
ncbi:MAG: hypothetical protein A2750_03345 [Candidatus Yanofskybacteria bacterium RIFCSPHIGHO2_01_FULL_45_42]|uniref:Uncharacterized protein n=3 Tax=Candidatus Yanofskyibacteriota TaxID=1752733 RepID=A0A1F8F611_9BACT|nr:MAG: hypothetical protein A2750_03345 [Candidatus Yanofskybacteria bacterium RIFCSPHIGHO2_01_FULL_45_42]OGN16561.1 MAG: hypothetical protein A3C81_00865 [Candidatus Yanofskybacteria bacterium RIFCSPHIGHO2_02_FULL_46_19]OGN32562.1 MAG: hypothetical protein A3J01_03145 [Candidatus Yanofskybacteria bacterium RIFCSPLOWO2_02_FULL_45_18]